MDADDASFLYVTGRVNQGIRRAMQARLAPWKLSVQQSMALSVSRHAPACPTPQSRARAVAPNRASARSCRKLRGAWLVRRPPTADDALILRAEMRRPVALAEADPAVQTIRRGCRPHSGARARRWRPGDARSNGASPLSDDAPEISRRIDKLRVAPGYPRPGSDGLRPRRDGPARAQGPDRAGATLAAGDQIGDRGELRRAAGALLPAVGLTVEVKDRPGADVPQRLGLPVAGWSSDPREPGELGVPAQD